MHFRNVPEPANIRRLPHDSRGYPIPYIVLIDANGNPQFAINDQMKQECALFNRMCPICGIALDKLLWWVGGPVSAFAPTGSYLDSAMHYDCMAYALQVCPYLAAPKYLKHFDESRAKVLKMPIGYSHILLNTTQNPHRPQVFVAIASKGFEITPSFPFYQKPYRPYEEVEFWRKGEKICSGMPNESDMAKLREFAANETGMD